MLIRSGHRRDYLIMNFGLHYTEDYKGELQTMVEQVCNPDRAMEKDTLLEHQVIHVLHRGISCAVCHQ